MQFIFQIFIAICLITVIILQAKGTGLGSGWGGNNYFHQKRGIEKSLFGLTIALAIIFVVVSAFNAL